MIYADSHRTGAWPRAHDIAHHRNRCPAIAFPNFGKLWLGIVKYIVDDLDTGARPEVNVRIAVAIMCAQIADETEMLRPLGIAAQKRTFVMPGNAFRKKRPAEDRKSTRLNSSH